MARPKKEVKIQYSSIAMERNAYSLLSEKVREIYPDEELSMGKVAIRAIGLYCNLVKAGKLEKAHDLVRKSLEVK